METCAQKTSSSTRAAPGRLWALTSASHPQTLQKLRCVEEAVLPDEINLHCVTCVLHCPLMLLSLSTRVKSGIPTCRLSASPIRSTWPQSTSCPSAVTRHLTCTLLAWSCMPSLTRANLFSKSTNMTFLRASAGSWTRQVGLM